MWALLQQFRDRALLLRPQLLDSALEMQFEGQTLAPRFESFHGHVGGPHAPSSRLSPSSYLPVVLTHTSRQVFRRPDVMLLTASQPVDEHVGTCGVPIRPTNLTELARGG